MLDKSLHFYLLTPTRREVLLAGKYAGRDCWPPWSFSPPARPCNGWPCSGNSTRPPGPSFLTSTGWSQFSSYLVVTALACVGYGSVFLAVGLLFRNPIIPTAIVLLWEGINPFLPAALKKISMIYYLQSLCPVDAAPRPGCARPRPPADLARPARHQVRGRPEHRDPDGRGPCARRPPVAEHGDQLQHGVISKSRSTRRLFVVTP